MIRYFREGLKPSIRAEIEQHDSELDSFQELVEKAKNAEAKAVFRPRVYARDTDQYCLRGNRPKLKRLRPDLGKDLRVEESKPRM